MRNLGNSCYMNSVMQVVFTLPDFVNKYVGNRDAYLKGSPIDPCSDFSLQMSKLGSSLLSGNYSHEFSDAEKSVNGFLRPPKGIFLSAKQIKEAKKVNRFKTGYFLFMYTLF